MSKRLANSFCELITLSKKQNVFVLYLIDGSGSISPSAFHTIENGELEQGPIKRGLSAIVSSFEGLVTQCIVQFATDQREECPPTKDTKKLLDAINGMKQIGSATCTKEAIRKGTQILEQYSTGYECYVILLTDGVPEDDNPEKEIMKVREMGVKLFVIGIGDSAKIPMAQLSTWSTNNSAWNIENWQDFVRVMKNMNEISVLDHEIVLLDVYPITNNIKAGNNLPLKLVVRTTGSDEILQGSFITFEKNSYFESLTVKIDSVVNSLSPFTTCTHLLRRADANEDRFPGQIDYLVSIRTCKDEKEVTLIQRNKITLTTGIMRGDFETEDPINVLLFGQRGNGKSATANSIISCLSLGHHPIRAIVTRTTDVVNHTTSNYQKIWVGDLLAQSIIGSDDPDDLQKTYKSEFDLNKLERSHQEHIINGSDKAVLEESEVVLSRERRRHERLLAEVQKNTEAVKKKLQAEARKLKLHVFDPWGSSSTTFVVGTTIEYLLRGKLRPGAPMTRVDDYVSALEDNANRIHVVVFIFPLTMVNITKERNDLNDLMNKTIREGYSPILVVTQIDNFEDLKEREEIQKKVLSSFPGVTTIFQKNYTTERSRDIEIDLKTREILLAIKKQYEIWKAAHPSYFKQVNWRCETILDLNVRRYCPNCSYALREGAFCNICGTETVQNVDNSPSVVKIKKIRDIVIYNGEAKEPLSIEKVDAEGTLDDMRKYISQSGIRFPFKENYVFQGVDGCLVSVNDELSIHIDECISPVGGELRLIVMSQHKYFLSQGTRIDIEDMDTILNANNIKVDSFSIIGNLVKMMVSDRETISNLKNKYLFFGDLEMEVITEPSSSKLHNTSTHVKLTGLPTNFNREKVLTLMRYVNLNGHRVNVRSVFIDNENTEAIIQIPTDQAYIFENRQQIKCGNHRVYCEISQAAHNLKLTSENVLSVLDTHIINPGMLDKNVLVSMEECVGLIRRSFDLVVKEGNLSGLSAKTISYVLKLPRTEKLKNEILLFELLLSWKKLHPLVNMETFLPLINFSSISSIDLMTRVKNNVPMYVYVGALEDSLKISNEKMKTISKNNNIINTNNNNNNNIPRQVVVCTPRSARNSSLLNKEIPTSSFVNEPTNLLPSVVNKEILTFSSSVNEPTNLLPSVVNKEIHTSSSSVNEPTNLFLSVVNKEITTSSSVNDSTEIQKPQGSVQNKINLFNKI